LHAFDVMSSRTPPSVPPLDEVELPDDALPDEVLPDDDAPDDDADEEVPPLLVVELLDVAPDPL
jgi:hypothetical protein